MQIKNHSGVTIDGRKCKVGIVVSRFNQEITAELLKSAKDACEKSGVAAKSVSIVSVAGAVEIPYALQQLATQKKYNCLVALGCVIRGETPHFDYVCKMVQEGVLRVSLDYDIPIGFGVITTNNIKQAKARPHVGGEATLAALELCTMRY